MSFGAGRGWGGGGTGEEEGPIAIWGPPGSGAIITPGPAWPTEAIESTKKWGILAVIAIVLLLASTD